MAEDKDYLEQEEENKEDYENVCFICRRPESKAGKMIDIPGGIHVCMTRSMGPESTVMYIMH